MVVALLSLLLAGAAVAQNDENCLPGTWLPEGADWTHCDEPGAPYDGSKVPDCSAFHGQVNTTSFFHVHEYDCGLFWICSPEGPCLMQCAACNTNPGNCPDGRLQFDCRYTVPVGPVCDFYSTVGCHNCEETCAANNCPGDTECDTSTDCQCSDCKTDADCSSGEMCCDRQCAISCDGDTTTSKPTPTTTPKPTTTNTPCPTECCSDDDCEDGTCENGECVPNTTTKNPNTTDGGDTTTAMTTACQFECCSNDDCEEGFICENGECKKPCSNDADCDGANEICNPTYDNCQYCSADNICENGCAGDSNCWADMPSCSAAHSCTEIGYPALIKITVQTYDCTNCNTANEGGLELVLEDNTVLTCSSGQLDNKEKTDYNNGMLAEFMAAEEDGLDGCEYANLNFHVTSGTAKWTGEGTWTKGSDKPLCFYYYDPSSEFYMIHNCCDLQDDVLTQGTMTELVNCVVCAGDNCQPAL